MDTQVRTDPPAARGKDASAVFHGIGVNDGAAAGKLKFISAANDRQRDPSALKFRGIETELSAFFDAREKARGQISEICQKTAELAGGDAAAIFEIHDMLLTDPDFTDGIESLIRSGVTAAEATENVTEEMAAVFESMEDEYLRGRAADMRDVGGRVADILYGIDRGISNDGGKTAASEKVIVVSRDLTPGETAGLDTSRVCGIVTFAGSLTSHSAILARALGIPAVVQSGNIPVGFDGKYAIIDAAAGALVVEPTANQLDNFYEKQKRDSERKKELEKVRDLPAETKNGKKIAIFANIGSAEEADAAHEAGAEGIGLFRSEFLFLGRSEAPSEEEQFRAYRKVLEIMSDKQGPVVVRTLDIGADKTLPYLNMPHEDNPALGVRGIRLCLQNEDLFRTQLRALCRASVYGKLAVMLPMIISADEIRQTRRIMTEEALKLRASGVPVADRIPLGIMIETPASAVMGRELAREADFFSVGTNDLCQYTFAADRQNPDLLPLMTGEDKLEAVFRLIKFAAGCIHSEGFEEEQNDGKNEGNKLDVSGSGEMKKWIGVCGELAADTSLTQHFIDCGADELSVSSPYVLPVKNQVRQSE
ncbi:MAG: phosphoenolpyruvate--protein phosphotransferase [Clostridia bacterium]|nr:phosphoenolpyruvate--protein phosphotransferase [Clostridia bacterium]